MTKRIVLKINELVADTGLSKAKIAKTIGMRESTLCTYTNSNIDLDKVSLKNLAKIADFLEIDDISQLLAIEDIKEGSKD